MKIISTNTKEETGDTYSRGSNIPTPNKRPPTPPVKHPKENKRQEQKDTCVNCRYYSVDPLSDPCDECIGKAGFGYNRLLLCLAYALDAAEFTEHGSSINRAWITDKGEVFLSTLLLSNLNNES